MTREQVSNRIAEAQAKLNARWLLEASQLLTDAGVPEVVEFVGEPVPSNTVPSRLKWYLLRRKDVSMKELSDADIAWIQHQRSLHEPYTR